MARAALRWSLAELADKSGISERTIRRCEMHDGKAPVSRETLVVLRKVFQANGMAFVRPPDTSGPGVLLTWNPLESEPPPEQPID